MADDIFKFKILKGESKNLDSKVPKTQAGHIYFTPDDGRLYIDVINDQTPYKGNGTNDKFEINGQEVTPNRICINDVIQHGPTDYILFDCGSATTAIDEGDYIILNGGSASTGI